MRTQAAPAEHGEAVEMAHPPAYLTEPASSTPVIKDTGFAAKELELDSLEDQSQDVSLTQSTPDDLAGMRRMGKDQELIRQFRVLSMTSFTALATAVWEIGLFLLTPALINGGRAGTIWSILWCFVGFGPVYLSMAEMASMAPIAGAQYHWVSEFAPDSCQRILSYIAGYDVLSTSKASASPT